MADEIIITSQFDIAPIVEGMEKIADSVKGGTAEINAAFEQVANAVIPSQEALQGAGQAAQSFLEQVGASTETAAQGLQIVAASSIEAVNAVEGMAAAAEGVTSLMSALTGLSESELEAATGGQGLQLALTRAAAGATDLLNSLGQTNEGLESIVTLSAEAQEEISLAGTGFANAAEAASAFGQSLELAGQGATNLLGQLGALELVEQEQVATTGEVAEAQAAAAESAQATATAVQQLNVVSAQTVNVLNTVAAILQANNAASQATATAINFLSNQNALLNATTQQVTQAVNTLNTALARNNLQITGTAGNLRLVQTAAQGAATAANAAAGAVNNLGGAAGRANGNLAYLAGRLGAMEVGLGNVGFAMGVLARTSAGLGNILVAAFPVIAAVALFDVVSTLEEKFIKFQDSIRKTGIEFEKLDEEAMRSADSIELQNLKLEDQIAKLEGRPEPNHLKEALLEAKDASDQLDTSLEGTIEKAIELVEKEGEVLHAVGEVFLSGVASSGDLPGKLRDPLVSVEEALRSHKLATDAVTDAKKKLNEVTHSEIADTLTLQQIEQKYNETAGEQKQAYYDLWTATVARTHALVDLKNAQKEVNDVSAQELANIPKSSIFDYGPRRLEIEKTNDAVNNAVRAEENMIQHERDLFKKAEVDKKTSYTAVSRAAEEAARKQLQIDDLVAQNAATAAKNILEAEKAAAIQNGADRELVEKSTAERLVSIEEDLITKKIADQNKYLQAVEAALDKEVKETEARKKGPARTQGLEDIASRRKLAEEQVEAEINKLKEEGVAKRTQLDQKEASEFVKEVEVKLQATRAGSKEAVDITTKAVEDIVRLYPNDLEAYRQLQEKKTEELRRFQENQQRILALDSDIKRGHANTDLEIQKIAVEAEASLGIIGNNQRLQSLRSLIQQQYKLELDAVNEEQALYQKGTVEFERAEKEKQQILDRYSKEMAQIDADELQSRLAAWHTFENDIISGFQRATGQMMTGQKSFTRGLEEEWNGMVIKFTQLLEAMLLKWVLNHTLMLVASKVFHAQDLLAFILSKTQKVTVDATANAQAIAQNAAKNATIVAANTTANTAILAGTTATNAAMLASDVGTLAAITAAQSAAAATSLGTTIATNTAKIFSDAAVAAAGALAWWSAIFPPVAPAMAAAAYAETASYAAAGIAEQGAVVPKDMPIFAHAQEMILPANISTGLQAMISGGGIAAASRAGTFLSSASRVSALTGGSSNKTVHVQPQINYYQQGNGPSRSELHDTIVSAVNIALRRGEIKGLN